MTVESYLQALEVYSKGTKAWFTDAKEAWISTTCVSSLITSDNVRLVFEADSNHKECVYETTLTQIEKTNGQDLPPLRNPLKLENTDDLTNLSYLNEPSVLNTIRTRYLQHLIYTYSGIVLIAVNPFDRVSLYDSDVVQQYSGRRRGELDPHLFAIAEDAYRCMVHEKSNQTIVVSGESGAGKTVSAKYIMRYFATADDQVSNGMRIKKSDGGLTEVEEQILATNPIMEAFGNAKTTRNDNSSRFGKYIEIQFDKHTNIVGAKIRTYLLERSRLIYQPETERNYHIFYQLCAGAPLSEKKEFELTDYTSFNYLNQNGPTSIPNVDDATEFGHTQRALSTVGLSVQLQWCIFRLLAALLHIGNVQITGRADAMVSESDESLLTATRLLGINATEFRKWIVRKQITTRSEKIITNLSPVQAQVVKDSVAKYIYANLFEWLVGVINERLSSSDETNVATFIGVLDIYGFEHFKKNSFEQFCINYANEKLQQQFNQHVFKLEQEEYVREQINWTFIEFSDNQKCIELIEGRMGILSLLDEESRMPSGSDEGFIQKLYTNFDKPEFKSHFKKPRFSNKAFTISHYAHQVEYESENFMDKNKDTVPDEHLALLRSTDFDFLKQVLDKAAAANPSPPVESKRMSMMYRKPTLGSIFKLSLINLMDTIGGTNVHYIRCIKPNEAKVAWEFEPNMVLSQLRACGVLETIRISCEGYPTRWTFEEFVDRYYALVSFSHWDPRQKPDVHQLASTILDEAIADPTMYQVGKTKIFFRAGQLAYLEKRRADRFNQCATLLQKHMRRYICRTRYLRIQSLTVGLQTVIRHKMAKKKMDALRRYRASLVIQTNWRRFIARKQYLAKQRFILSLQTAIRSRLGAQKLVTCRQHYAATQIQRMIRGWFARKHYKTQLQLVLLLQSCVRRRIAQKHFIALRSEARSASHLKEVSYALEMKVVELTQTLTTVRDEKKAMTDRTIQLETQIKTWMDKYEKMERKAKGLEDKLKEPTVPMEKWQALEVERDHWINECKQSSEQIKVKTRQTEELTTKLDQQAQETTKLRKNLDEANDKIKTMVDADTVTDLKSQITALKAQLSQALHAPRRQTSSTNIHGSSLAPNGGSNHMTRSVSPIMSPSTSIIKQQQQQELSTDSSINDTQTPDSPTPTILPGTSRKTVGGRRNSSAGVCETQTKSSLDHIRQTEISNKNPRPMSVDQYSKILGSKTIRKVTDLDEASIQEIHTILRDEDGLQQELVDGLIKGLRIPLPSLQNPPSAKEVFFPAHTIGICVMEMWRLNYVQESERMLFTIMDSIQKQCLSYTVEDAILPSIYWLSNVHELLSIICVAEQEKEQQMISSQHSTNGIGLRRSAAWNDFEKLTETIKFELQCLEDNIFHAGMKELKKCLSKMVISAVVEGQSLPGFTTTDSNRFYKRIIPGGSAGPTYTMDNVLNLLNKVWRAMKCYGLEASVVTQVLTELLKLIGVTAFNDLLMRKNFSSWKRAMQIQYNITRIEEWCKSHDLNEGILQLEHLMQSTKLLQMKKATLEDIENIYEACWILSPTQVQKLMSNYYVADYENPITSDILQAVAEHVISGNKSDILLLDSVALDDTSSPFEIPVVRNPIPQPYLPAWLSKLERLRRLIHLVPLENLTGVQ
ncbi:P-loop containing nucleoside triphosphate hydrolase protein [Halteromyces radiatus]|uniref:P-loop containing nucleoside triphosphate hydrolase protein n=1 Tax=Halteromyces radiatus TaxID=101107 RepID=UPI00221E84D8|nr:P-loop containing nucleoside triphosphate hydrolase protein [Halteromyces radiatus]KAI8083120.1 P-loop containing nucleoside triphosphate hydrolase protein [Halteromyces radiatus]